MAHKNTGKYKSTNAPKALNDQRRVAAKQAFTTVMSKKSKINTGETVLNSINTKVVNRRVDKLNKTATTPLLQKELINRW